MCRNSAKRGHEKMSFLSSRFAKIFLLLIFGSTLYIVVSFRPMSKEEHIENYNKINEYVEPFRRNLSECAHQVKASMVDVENFLKRIPQRSMEGKCFVACILRRNALITKNKINQKNLLEANNAVYGENGEVMDRLREAVRECSVHVESIFEICEYASEFNDCMHMKMEHILDKATMERRMQALGQMTSNADEWDAEDEEILRLVKDEL